MLPPPGSINIQGDKLHSKFYLFCFFSLVNQSCLPLINSFPVYFSIMGNKYTLASEYMEK